MTTPIAIGTTMYEKETLRPFIVLCNCSASKPRNHTQRYVSQNRHEFLTVQEYLDAHKNV
jgi:hypothetical protein